MGCPGVVDAFADGDHAAAVALVGGLHVGQEAVDLEGALGHVDQVRAVVGELLAQRRGRGQEAGVPPHHHAHVDARQRRVVEVGAGKGLGHEARRAGKPGVWSLSTRSLSMVLGMWMQRSG
jgi:hypothetical protein